MKHIMKSGLLIVCMSLITFSSFAQDNFEQNVYLSDDNPKLVVGIVVDQIRYEYLPRFWNKYGDDGFKRLVNEGYSFTNHHYNYFPTYTGPGHAAVYTGTTPAVNGIVGNSWYDRSIGRDMYVVSDSTVQTVGGQGAVGRMSPANLLSTTVTDELKTVSPESKVIGVSIKDRGAVLPAGHLGDAAYWYDSKSGNFVTSSWYRDELPDWVRAFNKEGLAREFSKKTWETLLPIEEYTESNADDSPYEGVFSGESAPVFPHDMNGSVGRILSSPFGNTLVKELARHTIEGEQMGADDITDFLAVSFSSTDYVGHRFGPHSIEVQDTYLRLDRDLADLLSFLDDEVGKGKYIVFLTSDHGVVDVPAELMDRGLPGGYFDSKTAVDSLESYFRGKYGEGNWVEAYTNQQVYLNRDLLEREEISLKAMQDDAARYLQRFEGVRSVNTALNLLSEGYSEGIQAMYQNGFLYDRSGDVFIQLKPGWLDSSSRTGTSHGSPYNYDTHVPLIFYGWNIPHGVSQKKTVIPQIAPTVSTLLNINFPNGSEAEVLTFE